MHMVIRSKRRAATRLTVRYGSSKGKVFLRAELRDSPTVQLGVFTDVKECDECLELKLIMLKPTLAWLGT